MVRKKAEPKVTVKVEKVKVEKGMRVAYAPEFINSIHKLCRPWAEIQRGTVEAVEPCGASAFASVRWDGGRLSPVLRSFLKVA